MTPTLEAFGTWLISLKPREKQLDNETDRLRLSMRTTAKARYTASVRLKYQGKFTFATTTLLSLGLIFIPLIQNSGVPLALKVGVLNAMQIFLAVSVLVYSVIIGTARYDLRSEQLNECGDKLKELIRELGREKEAGGGKLTKEQLARFHERYSDIATDVENHTRTDYMLTTLEMDDDYSITGLPRLYDWLKAQFFRAVPFLPPLSLLLVEVVFITDILGVTTVFAKLLNGTYVPNAG